MKHNAFTCDHCGQCHPIQEGIQVGNDLLCPSCAERLTVLCDHCGERIYLGDSYSDGHLTLCRECRDYSYHICDNCGRFILESQTHYAESDEDELYPLCEDCVESRNGECIIHRFDYRPDPIFYGKGLRHFGVELEIDSGGQDSVKASKLLAAANERDPHLYIKTDGSLDDGLELVTYPMTLDYHLHQMPWENVLQTARSLGYYSHRAGTCGLHVHISRTAFGITEQEQEAAIARLVYFVEHFWTEVLRFSRRTTRQVERWAARYGAKLTPEDTKKHLKSIHSNRYMAVNLTNTYTVEIRIFRGTLKLNTLLATLQFVDRLCDLAVYCDDAALQRLSWHEFARAVREPELIQYLKERDLYVNEPVESEEDD